MCGAVFGVNYIRQSSEYGYAFTDDDGPVKMDTIFAKLPDSPEQEDRPRGHQKLGVPILRDECHIMQMNLTS